jgi:O-antigen/teichoic acid export membrane protein
MEALPLGLTSIFTMIYLNLDKVILFNMKGAAEVGWYSAANKFILFIKSTGLLYMPVVFPALSNFYVTSRDHFNKLLIKSFYYIFMATIAISIGATILAKPIVLLIFGGGFIGSVLSLKIMMWAMPMIVLTALLGTSFISIGKQKECLYIVLSGLMINAAANLLFVPAYGYLASSYAVLLAESCMFILSLYYAVQFYGFKPSLIKIVQILAAAAVMGALTYWMSGMNVFIDIVLSGAAYFLLLLLFRAVGGEDWTLLKKILSGSI